ncbi:MAG: 7,8-didemethyl-8-hydroxy-5-deazariboflavin synthase subunit CofG [Candidatus Syntropharchaeia archaeon]
MSFVTFSKNVFIPLTNVCRNACAYCGFRRSVYEDDATLMEREEVERIFERRGNATEALFTFGEKPEKIPIFREWLGKIGYSGILDYLYDLCELAIEKGLLPHSNPGILSHSELKKLKEVNASMGLMLETTANLEVHRNSPGKDPKLRIKTIKDAGRLEIPFTTGILVGIGESMEDRKNSLLKIRELHERYDHIQEVIIQPFSPKSSTPMSNHPPPTPEEMKKTVLIAKKILKDIPIQIPPNLTNPKELIECGASDLGGISEKTIDYINPEHPWPDVDELRRKIYPFELRERLPVYPRYVRKRWYGKEVEELVERYAGEDGLRR